MGTVALIACDSGTQTQEQDARTTTDADTTSTATGATDTSLSNEKREFMGYAYNTSNLQVELGKLAVEKGRSDQAKQYGKRMVDLHGKKQGELKEMSQRYGVTLPQNMTDDQSGRIQELRDTNPENFDKAYWDNVIDAHKEAVDEFERSVKDIAPTDTTAFSLWALNSTKEIRAQMEEAMRFRLDQRQ